MILNENKFFHLNFYSSWCSFFSLSFRTYIAFNELFKRTKILIWKELFCPVVTYYICRPIRRFFYYRNLPAQSKLSRNLINNFFNYLRFFIWTGNFNRHYTSTLMARACESNDNKTKGFFFFFSCRVLAVEYCRRAGWKARLPCLWRYCDVTWDVLLASTVNSSERYKIDH